MSYCLISLRPGLYYNWNVDAENDPMMPMIERNVKYGSYFIPDLTKPYENTPL